MYYPMCIKRQGRLLARLLAAVWKQFFSSEEDFCSRREIAIGYFEGTNNVDTYKCHYLELLEIFFADRAAALSSSLNARMF